MTGQETRDKNKGVRLYPPPSKDFDPFTASEADLIRHGLPLRPDPRSQPGMAALWDRQARRYRHFDHLEPRPNTATAAKKAVSAPALGPDPIESCGYQLFSSSEPFTALFVTWTVPDLWYSPGPARPHQPLSHLRRSRLPRRPRRDDRRPRRERHELPLGTSHRAGQPAGPPRGCDQRLAVSSDQSARHSVLLLRQRDHGADDQLRGRHRVPPCGHHRRGRHSYRRTPASPPSYTRWHASGSSTSTKSAPTQRVAPGRSRRAMPSPWSTKTAGPSPAPSGSTTTPSRPCSKQPDR